MDFPTRLSPSPQSQNYPGLVPGRNSGFHHVIRMAPLQPRFESAGLCHMGHFGGKGQCCPTPQPGFPEETSTGRMAQIIDVHRA